MSDVFGLDDIGIATKYKQEQLLKDAREYCELKQAMVVPPTTGMIISVAKLITQSLFECRNLQDRNRSMETGQNGLLNLNHQR